MAQILWRLIFDFLCYFDAIDSSGWMGSIAFLTTSLIFLGSLGLRLISKRGGLGLRLVFGSLIARLLVGVLLVFFR